VNRKDWAATRIRRLQVPQPNANDNYGFVYHLDEAARAKEKGLTKILWPKYEMSLEQGGLTAQLLVRKLTKPFDVLAEGFFSANAPAT
jgi:hypothetical protein